MDFHQKPLCFSHGGPHLFSSRLLCFYPQTHLVPMPGEGRLTTRGIAVPGLLRPSYPFFLYIFLPALFLYFCGSLSFTPQTYLRPTPHEGGPATWSITVSGVQRAFILFCPGDCLFGSLCPLRFRTQLVYSQCCSCCGRHCCQPR